MVERSGIDPARIGQVIGGCVSQMGDQAFNVTRNAWLSQGLPLEIVSTTVDSQCGSSQQATSLATRWIGAGPEDGLLTCGVERMSRVPLGSNVRGGFPPPASDLERFAAKTQFEGAERITTEFGISREEADASGLRSQELAQRAWRKATGAPEERLNPNAGAIALGHPTGCLPVEAPQPLDPPLASGRPALNDGCDRLSEALVGDPDHPRVLDRGVRLPRLLHLLGADLLAGRVDADTAPAQEGQGAVRLDPAPRRPEPRSARRRRSERCERSSPDPSRSRAESGLRAQQLRARHRPAGSHGRPR